jgi:hypothetical protein
VAFSASPSKPRYADSVPWGIALDPIPEFDDSAHDLVAKDQGQVGVREISIVNVQVGATYCAGTDL